MNSIEQFINFDNLNETHVMNALQNNGVISDNCVWARDVGNPDEAVEWLTRRGWAK